MAAGIAHGGRLIEAGLRYPQAPRPFLDLSTGINPYAYEVPLLPRSAFTRLPEPEQLTDLQEAAARAYRASDAAMVVASPGTQIAISLLPHLLGLRVATILGPTYGGHQAAWAAAGAAVRLAPDFAAFAKCARAYGGAAILCNPNNPDGRTNPRPAMLELAGEMAGRGGVLIVDEAFADLQSPDPGLAAALPHAGLLILRSFGKSYGLAGLRLGFLLADPPLAAMLRTTLGDWAVSGPALAIGRAALADADWRQRTGARLHDGCARLDRMFSAARLKPRGGTRLFRLFGGATARATHHALAESGILTRRFEHDAELLRVGLPGCETTWTRLQAALQTSISIL